MSPAQVRVVYSWASKLLAAKDPERESIHAGKHKDPLGEGGLLPWIQRMAQSASLWMTLTWTRKKDINMQFRNGNLIRQPEYLAKSLNPILVDNAIRGNPGQEISNMDCGSVKDFAPLTGRLPPRFRSWTQPSCTSTRYPSTGWGQPRTSWDKIASVQ